jgi:hypothetical protein
LVPEPVGEGVSDGDAVALGVEDAEPLADAPGGSAD